MICLSKLRDCFVGMFRVLSFVVLVALALILSACASPPSVTPLLTVVNQALADEVAALVVDGQRDGARVNELRDNLADAFARDLQETPELSPRWVTEASEGYALAREALLRHELTLAEERQRRTENLRVARQAQDRALELLQQQDKLLTDTLRLDLWHLAGQGEVKP